MARLRGVLLRPCLAGVVSLAAVSVLAALVQTSPGDVSFLAVAARSATQSGILVVTKADVITDDPLAGASFRVFDKKDRTSTLAILTTNSDGSDQVSLPVGETYCIEETAAPQGYQLAPSYTPATGCVNLDPSDPTTIAVTDPPTPTPPPSPPPTPPPSPIPTAAATPTLPATQTPTLPARSGGQRGDAGQAVTALSASPSPAAVASSPTASPLPSPTERGQFRIADWWRTSAGLVVVALVAFGIVLVVSGIVMVAVRIDHRRRLDSGVH